MRRVSPTRANARRGQSAPRRRALPTGPGHAAAGFHRCASAGIGTFEHDNRASHPRQRNRRGATRDAAADDADLRRWNHCRLSFGQRPVLLHELLLSLDIRAQNESEPGPPLYHRGTAGLSLGPFTRLRHPGNALELAVHHSKHIARPLSGPPVHADFIFELAIAEIGLPRMAIPAVSDPGTIVRSREKDAPGLYVDASIMTLPASMPGNRPALTRRLERRAVDSGRPFGHGQIVGTGPVQVPRPSSPR